MAKEIKIGKKTYTVRELVLREIRELTSMAEENPIDSLCRLLTMSTTATPEDLFEYKPSEVQEFIDAVMEVNAPFLSMAEAANMQEVADGLRGLIRSIFLGPLSCSLKEATE